MADKLMYIPNDDTQNYLFFSVTLVVRTFEHSTLKKKPKKIKYRIESR